MCGAWQPGGLWETAPGRSLALRPRLSTGLPSLQTVRRQPIWLPRCSATIAAGLAQANGTKVLVGASRNREMLRRPAARAQPRLDDPLGRPVFAAPCSTSSDRRSGRCRGPAATRSTPGRAAGRSRSPGRTRSRASAGDRAATTARRLRRSPTGGAPGPARRSRSRAPRHRRRRRRRRRSRARS